MFLLLKPKIFRHIIQMSISLFLLYVGWKFYKFTLYVQSGGKLPYIDKPEAVEGFLPISALLGFKQWLLTGVYDPIHPAGLTIFLAVLITALIFKKGFCSWLCPIGTISEGLALAGEKMFGKNFTLPRWLDLLLMSLKYLILAFFMKVIFLDMSIFSIQAFLNSPYNMVADIKMLYFFLDISRTTYYVLLTLAFFSLFIKQFWCRYLCPYGALQGLISILSFFKIRRKENQCINCGLCNKNCPGMISVSEKQTISSPECTGCLNCISVCPQENCLSINIQKPKIVLKPITYGTVLIGTFFFILLIAQLTGHWESNVSIETLSQLAPQLDKLSHP